MSKLLPKDALSDAIGLVVTSPAPLTTTVRTFLDGDLSHSVPSEPVSSSALVTPIGKKQIVLSGATTAGTVTIVASDESGRRVAKRRVDVVEDRGFSPAARPGNAGRGHVGRHLGDRRGRGDRQRRRRATSHPADRWRTA